MAKTDLVFVSAETANCRLVIGCFNLITLLNRVKLSIFRQVGGAHKQTEVDHRVLTPWFDANANADGND